MKNDELLSKTISYLRFPLTVGIVFIHFSLHEGLEIHGIKHGLDNPEWFFFIVYFISQVLARIGVPLFFVISGFLFFYGKDFSCEIYKGKLKTRYQSLFIPFVIWNVIAIIWQMKCFLPILSSFYSPFEIHLSLGRIFNTFFCNNNINGILVGPPSAKSSSGNPIDVPLWYVRDLMVMVMFSPLIYWMTRKIGYCFSIGTGLVWFSSALFIPKDSYVDHLVTASFFFSVGASYSILKENIVVAFRKLKFTPILYLPIAFADALTKGMEYNEYLHKFGIVIGIIAAVVVASYFVNANKGKVCVALANSSFFIFALHYLFIGDVGKFAFTVSHVPENNPYAMLALYFTVPIFSILVCLALYEILKRYAPKLSNLLTGGR